MASFFKFGCIYRLHMCSSKQGKRLPVTCHVAQQWSKGAVPFSPDVRAPWRQKSPGSHLRMVCGPRAGFVVFWKRENSLPPPEYEPRTRRSVASRCTDYAILTLVSEIRLNIDIFTLTGIRKYESPGYHRDSVEQCFSAFVRPRPGKFFLHKTSARSEQIYS